MRIIINGKLTTAMQAAHAVLRIGTAPTYTVDGQDAPELVTTLDRLVSAVLNAQAETPLVGGRPVGAWINSDHIASETNGAVDFLGTYNPLLLHTREFAMSAKERLFNLQGALTVAVSRAVSADLTELRQSVKGPVPLLDTALVVAKALDRAKKPTPVAFPKQAGGE